MFSRWLWQTYDVLTQREACLNIVSCSFHHQDCHGCLHDVDDGVDVDGNGDNSPTLLLHVMILFILRSKKQIRLNGVKLQFCDLSNKWDISRLRLNVRSSRFFCDKISAIESIAPCLTRVLQRVLHLVLQLHRVLHSLQSLVAGVESLLTAIEVSLNGDCRFVHVGICLNDTSCLFQTEWRNWIWFAVLRKTNGQWACSERI